jgi:hypothetical protein
MLATLDLRIMDGLQVFSGIGEKKQSRHVFVTITCNISKHQILELIHHLLVTFPTLFAFSMLDA